MHSLSYIIHSYRATTKVLCSGISTTSNFAVNYSTEDISNADSSVDGNFRMDNTTLRKIHYFHLHIPLYYRIKSYLT